MPQHGLLVSTQALDPELWVNNAELLPAPIAPEWIIEGRPIARNRLIFASIDGTASTYLWDCTSGRFNWYYDVDETICLLVGEVTLVDAAGTSHQLRAGDVFTFQAGTRFEWTVPSYVRKIAFIHSPLSRKILLVRWMFNALKKLSPGRRATRSSVWSQSPER